MRALSAGVVTSVLAALVLPVLTSGSAQADTAPIVTEPVTVSADALPTVQVNGVVWAQVIVGSTVYVTGEFTSARPAGSSAGTNETPRSNILAYNIDTGALISSWAPTLNAQGLAIAASADGKTIYVGGEFTDVSGVAKNRIVALDAATGAVVTAFKGSLNSTVKALAVSGNTVYAGGGFTTAAGQTRTRLAAFDATTGDLLSWAPTADAVVNALLVLPTVNKVVVGGRLGTLNGTSALGWGAVDATTGATLSWPAQAIFNDWGTKAAMTSLVTDGTQVYASGYNFGGNGNLEAEGATDLNGNLIWVNGCKGDTYNLAAANNVLYSVSHSHDCSSVGDHPQTSPDWTYQRAQAFTTTVGGTNASGSTYAGRPAPKVLHWLPTLVAGSYTGQVQAAWSVAADSKYVVLGGEFPSVNGTQQYGLVRMAVREVAPDKEGPRPFTANPTATSPSAGTVKLSWTATWDRDNKNLTYEILRNGTVVGQVKSDSTWWTLPSLSYTDTKAPGGTTATYQVRAKDAYGNAATTASVSVAVTAGTPATSAYPDAVSASSPANYWRLGETSGTTAADSAGNKPLTLSGATRNVTGALTGDTNKAVTMSGSATVPGTTTSSQTSPTTFSEEVWFKTNTTKGGKLIGFGNSRTTSSTTSDRHIYMNNSGQLYFGVLSSGGTKATINSSAAYNNNAWHYAAATWSAANGAKLYVDGQQVASSAAMNTSQSYTGYWRLGGDSLSTGSIFNTSNWPSKPTNTSIAASLDEPAVYSTELTAAAVADHYTAGSQGTPANKAPTAALSYTAKYRTVSFTAAGSADPDGTIASYAWDFGDGSTATTTDPTTTHAYATTGSFTAKVTVTDNGGATASTQVVATTTTPLNQSPTASFTSAVTGLSVAFDASASKDDDGTIASYAWNFGDGTTGTGVTASHTYGAAGAFPVTLTVTDDSGATSVSSASVTTTQGGTQTVIAADAFGRTVAAGLGNADNGGAWSVSSTTLTSVADGAAKFTLAGAKSASARLGSVSSTTTDLTGTVWTDSMPTGAGIYLAISGRSTTAGDYRARVRIGTDGAVSAGVTVSAGTAETAIGSQAAVAGLTYAAGDKLNVRTQVSGASPTTIRMKVWKAGTTEPAAWTREVTDSTDGYQVAGGIGLYSYNGTGGATQGARFDDLTATGALIAANQAPTAAFTATPTALAVAFDGSGSTDADGTVASYAWDFGDNTTGTGVAPSHTYAAAGTYTVKLTVTDDKGATGVLSQNVTVTAAQDPNVIAADTFERTVATGFGSADTGGAWTTTGSTSTFSVGNGAASVTTPAGGTSMARLDGVPQQDVDETHRVWIDAMPTGSGIYYSTLLRRDTTADYRAKVFINPAGKVQVYLTKIVSGTETTLTTAQTVTGLTVTPGTVLKVRSQAVGVNPTTLNIKVWADGSAEPAAWQQTVTDSTAVLQDAGTVGLAAYLSGSATAPVTGHYDDLVVRKL
ncbi:PKD domain-containing protein [Spongisporangium articulatum]|uniref:PKD domain-containing protein n=1 Tax=Spongisporangium articulatum TaxID=3362603 RepID=A0ABW8ATA8_9ACTN